jgi:major membrane immunogen (membrane-anchored lipoprotein)
LTLLTACAGNNAGSGDGGYTAGSYTAVSSEDDKGAYAEVTIVFADNKIVSCEFITRQKDGTIKDENYGKVNGEISNPDYYSKAQLAVEAMGKYAEKLTETQNLDEIEVISGATIAYDQFDEAVGKIFKEARK